jgi:hypothetical protein
MTASGHISDRFGAEIGPNLWLLCGESRHDGVAASEQADVRSVLASDIYHLTISSEFGLSLGAPNNEEKDHDRS